MPIEYSAGFPHERDPSIVARHRGPGVELILRAYYNGPARRYAPPTLVLWRGQCGGGAPQYGELGELGELGGQCLGWKLAVVSLIAIGIAARAGWIGK